MVTSANSLKKGGVTILVGAQWGDEGKGKWIDILAENTNIVARYQGGNNAGHTLYVDGEKVVLHQIPSGIFREGQTCALTSGVVINPVEMVEEIKKVQKIIQVSPDRLWLSARSHVISPWHIWLDGKKEKEAQNPIGTTKRGIGPAYSDKAARVGLRLGEYIDPVRRQAWFDRMSYESEDFSKLAKENAEAWEAFHGAAEKLASYVCNAEQNLRAAMQHSQTILLEGAQGALLDINHGTYPYVTSSETCSGGAFASLGFAPKYVDKVYGVAKAYVTRVGEGPFPSELHDEDGAYIAKQGNEFGATTGRPRRCGWLDAVALKYCQEVNGFDGIILNKMDILTGMQEIKICTAYKHPKLGLIKEFPWDGNILAECKPVCETLPGWTDPMPTSGKIADLPENALKYIAAVEQAANCKVTMVGTGVNRTDGLFL
ncbi:MAG: adenylosuccinate synthase [Zetaproteobacteria bacterium]|nr:adenylosuccinate synthase [Pseudobdellovibrionaceae bacterium]